MYEGNRNGGWIEVIAGGMFSGKSEELMRRLARARIARLPIQVFKHSLDDRFDAERIVSRNNQNLDALTAATSAELFKKSDAGARVVAIDEVQFFDEGIVEVCMKIADRGARVIVAGLDQDYRRQPFGPMPGLLAVAEYVTKLHAVCIRCGGPAHYSYRLTEAVEQIQVGDTFYEARCRSCFMEG